MKQYGLILIEHDPNRQVGKFELASSIAELLATGQYEFAPAFIRNEDGSSKLIEISLIPKHKE